MRKFYQKLDKIQQKNNSLLCVGLDTDMEKIPKHLLKQKDPIYSFNKSIIDATYYLVCAYKPNIAFYEAEGEKGIRSLKKTIDYIIKNYPDIVLICDAKRADIGNTNIGYTKAIFDYFGFDAVTVNPYLGQEALLPFFKRKDKGIFILCRTSNPGSGELQDLIVDDPKYGQLALFKLIAQKTANEWNTNNNCVLVVGATYPNELAEIRKLVGDMPLLVPGIGAQGGDIAKTVKVGRNTKGSGLIINSSRDIIYAGKDKNFKQMAEKKAKKLRTLININR